MARHPIPGLQIQTSGRSGNSQGHQRTPVDYQRALTPTRPQASPVDTYTGRPSVISAEETEAFQVVRGLGVLGSGLEEAFTSQHNQRVREAELEAQQSVQNMSRTEVADLVRSGQLSLYDDPYRHAAMARMTGIRMGNERIRERLATFARLPDPSGLDIDAFLHEGFGADTVEGDDPAYLAGYHAAVANGAEVLRGQHVEAETTEHLRWRDEAITGALFTIGDQAMRDGISPEDAVQQILAARPGILDRFMELTSNRDLLSYLWSTAQQFAEEGNLPLVEALVNADLGNGVTLARRTEYRDDIQSLIARARTRGAEEAIIRDTPAILELSQQADEGSLDGPAARQALENGQITVDRYHALLERNRRAQNQLREQRVEQATRAEAVNSNLAEVIATPGRYQTLDYTALGFTSQAGMDRDFLGAFRNGLRGGRYTEEQQLNATIRFSADTGIRVPEWENMFASVAGGLPGVIDGDVADTQVQAFELFRHIRSASPGLARQYASGDNLNALETYNILVSGTYSPEAAIQLTARTLAVDPQNDRTLTLTTADIASRLDDLTEGGLFTTAPINRGYVASYVEPLAQALMRTGQFTEEEAIRQAGQSFEETHTVFNGAYIPALNTDLPPGFLNHTMAFLDRVAEENPMAQEVGATASDLYIQPTVDGNVHSWTVHINDPSTGYVPIQTFTLDEAQAAYQALRDDQIVELRDRIDARRDFFGADLRETLTSQENDVRALGTVMTSGTPEELRGLLDYQAQQYGANAVLEIYRMLDGRNPDVRSQQEHRQLEAYRQWLDERGLLGSATTTPDIPAGPQVVNAI